MILTGPKKLLCHPSILAGERKPISFQLSLTGRCNQKCSYCIHEGGREDMNGGEAFDVLTQLHQMGAKAVELTGGGEPTLHPDFDNIAGYALRCGLEVGLVTNGSRLLEVTPEVLGALSWIRISATAYVPDSRTIDAVARLVKPNKGLSVVVADDVSLLGSWRGAGFRYVRVCADVRQKTRTESGLVLEQLRVTHPAAEVIDDCNRERWVAERCLIGYYKPAIGHNGQVYRCCFEFNADRNPQCHWRHMGRHWYEEGRRGLDVDTRSCTFCHYGAHNDLLWALSFPMPMNTNFL